MLTRWITAKDKSAWQQLAGTVTELFDSPNMPFEQCFSSYIRKR